MSGLARLLLIIGGLNYALMGLGGFIHKDLNFLVLLNAFYPNLPYIIYSIIGAAAIWIIFKS